MFSVDLTELHFYLVSSLCSVRDAAFSRTEGVHSGGCGVQLSGGGLLSGGCGVQPCWWVPHMSCLRGLHLEVVWGSVIRSVGLPKDYTLS